jgi:hypothetical protein
LAFKIISGVRFASTRKIGEGAIEKGTA